MKPHQSATQAEIDFLSRLAAGRSFCGGSPQTSRERFIKYARLILTGARRFDQDINVSILKAVTRRLLAGMKHPEEETFRSSSRKHIQEAAK